MGRVAWLSHADLDAEQENRDAEKWLHNVSSTRASFLSHEDVLRGVAERTARYRGMRWMPPSFMFWVP